MEKLTGRGGAGRGQGAKKLPPDLKKQKLILYVEKWKIDKLTEQTTKIICYKAIDNETT